VVKRWKGLGPLVIAGLVVLVLVASSCAPAAPVVKESVVKIGQMAIFTGPLATLGVPAGHGMIDYVEYLNEKGGVDGIKVEMLWEDTGYLVPKLLSAYKRLNGAGVVVQISATGTVADVAPELMQKEEVPLLYPGCYTRGMIMKPVPWVLPPSKDGPLTVQ
jgi:branched-chain amino acid transport system substrate-binding protein